MKTTISRKNKKMVSPLFEKLIEIWLYALGFFFSTVFLGTIWIEFTVFLSFGLVVVSHFPEHPIWLRQHKNGKGHAKFTNEQYHFMLVIRSKHETIGCLRFASPAVAITEKRKNRIVCHGQLLFERCFFFISSGDTLTRLIKI